MLKSNDEEIQIVKGRIKRNKKEHYEWEGKKTYQLEPWWLSSIALIINICILIMIMFIDVISATIQLRLAQIGIFICFTLISVAYIWLKKKSWSLTVLRFTTLINVISLIFSFFMLFLIFLIS